MEQTKKAAAHEEPPAELPPFMRAVLGDLDGIDFEAPIADASTAECRELSDLYHAALRKGEDNPPDTPTTRIFGTLASITGMHFKPDDRGEPFGAMLIWNDRRSAIPSDFRNNLDLLALMAERARNPVLRARLSDVCWILDRKRSKLASAAISAYVEIVQKMERQELTEQFSSGGPGINYTVSCYLRRALHLGWATGWDKDEVTVARRLVADLRKQATTENATIPVQWFCNLDLDFLVSNPADVATDLNVLLTGSLTTHDTDAIHALWLIAARAYHLAKQEDDKFRCQIEAAELLVVRGLAQQQAMLASHYLGAAISHYHGIPRKKDRRTELRHKLIDIQSRITEELPIYRHEMPTRDIAEKVGKIIGQQERLLDSLFVFAGLEVSPEPDKLVLFAKELIGKYPFSSTFGATHLDREGKVIHRSAGASFKDDKNDEAIRHKIAQSEKLRRAFVVGSKINPARQSINERYLISDDILVSLLQHSPFIPNHLLHTYSRGFTRFFQGDFISAIYILTPLLENSLRYVLKTTGNDVSIFDDANQTQKDYTISMLFEHKRFDLSSILGDALVNDIENVFLARPGPCLRHDLAHGLLSDGDPHGADAIYGAWLIFRLCVCPLYSHHAAILKLWNA